MAGAAFWQPLAGDGSAATADGMSTIEVADAAPNGLARTQQAVYDAGSDTTFVALLGEGRDLYVTAYHHPTGQTTSSGLIDTYPLPDDDGHGKPSINIDHDGYLHVFWGAHGLASGGASHEYSKTDNPRDVSAWTTTTLHAGTYPLLIVDDDGDLLLFDRAGTAAGATFPSKSYMGFRRSTDGGATWSTYAGIVNVTGDHSGSMVYPQAAELVDGVVHLTWTVHRGATSVRDNVYHAIFDPSTSTLSAADGTDLGSQVIWSEHPTALAATVSDITGAQPFTRSASAIHIAYNSADVWRVANWNGTAWSTTNTSITSPHESSRAAISRWGDGLLALFPTRTGSFSDIAVHTSPDGSTWHSAGVLLEGDTGEGWENAGPVLGGRWVALTQQIPTSRAETSATASDLLPVLAIEGLPAPSPHGNEHHSSDFATDGAAVPTFAAGSDTIADTTSTQNVSHGLGVRPATVLLTPRANTAVWVSDRGTSTFTAERSGSSGDLDFDWLATGEEEDPGASFDPLSIAWHTAFWADDPNWTNPGDGNTISQWDDASGNGRHATQATGTAQPRFRASTSGSAINGKACVGFDGNDYLNTASFTNITGTSEHVVVCVIDSLTATAATPFHSPTSGKRRAVQANTTSWFIYAGSSSQGGGTADTGVHLLRSTFDGSTGADTLHVDEVSTISADAGSEALDAIRLGGNTGLNQMLTGRIAFYGHVSGNLTSTERSDLLGWAQAYYGTP